MDAGATMKPVWTHKVDSRWLNHMFKIAGVDKAQLHAALRTMGTKHLKDASMRKIWSPENPTQNYCYVVAEYVYWYKAPVGAKPKGLKIPSYDTTHRFVEYPCGCFVDLSCDQFYDFTEVDYGKAKTMAFMQTGARGPSKRAKMLAQLMGDENDAMTEWTFREVRRSVELLYGHPLCLGQHRHPNGYWTIGRQRG